MSVFRMRKKNTYILTVIVLLVYIGVFVFQHPIVIKMVTGTARLITSQLDTNVFMDGSLSVKSKVFYEATRFDGTPAERLIIWFHGNYPHRVIFTLDLDTKLIGLPNASGDDYDIIFNKLIQSESGDMSVSITDGKCWPEHDPDLKIKPNIIEFILPKSEFYPQKVKIELPNEKTFPFG